MAVSNVNALMNQVTSFMSNQASQGVQQASSQNKEEGNNPSGGVVRSNSIVHSGKSEAFKVSFTSAALSKHSVLTGNR
ncbi:MAG: hypothetical protein HQL72_08845 [Magnetococcales bacterium]|nr:hypothetical protein [Magnetococcales bacterium]